MLSRFGPGLFFPDGRVSGMKGLKSPSPWLLPTTNEQCYNTIELCTYPGYCFQQPVVAVDSCSDGFRLSQLLLHNFDMLFRQCGTSKHESANTSR